MSQNYSVPSYFTLPQFRKQVPLLLLYRRAAEDIAHYHRVELGVNAP